MSDSDKPATNGAKAFGGFMAVIALGAFSWMLWQAQTSNLETESKLTKQHFVTVKSAISDQNRLLEKHADSDGHVKLSERVKSLESNGVMLRHQDRLIRMLWRRVYDEEMPAVNGGH